jgi:hypothetical protein
MLPPRKMRRAVLAATLALAAGATAPAAHADLTLSGPAEVSEASGTVTYTVTRTLPILETTATITVTGAGPPTPATLEWGLFEDGAKTFTVPVDDALDQDPDRHSATVSVSSDRDSVTGSPLTTDVIDDDTTVDATPSQTTAAEGGTATFTLVPRVAPTRDLSVDYAVEPGTADAAEAVGSGTVLIPAGSIAPQTITIPIAQDTVDEDDETFTVRLSAAGVPLAVNAVGVTITDDDDAPLVGVVSGRVVEGTGPANRIEILVGLSRPSSRTVTVAYATRDGTATAPADYGAAVGRVFFGPGETIKSVPVFITGDAVAEPDEAFSLLLSNPQHATLTGVADASAIVIVDDDGGSVLAPLVAPAVDNRPPRVRLTRPAGGGSKATLRVTCPASETRCSGQVTLFSVASRRARLGALRQEHRLGAARFTLAGGKSARLTIRLSSSARSLIRRARRLRVRAYAVTRDAANNTATANVSATLRR